MFKWIKRLFITALVLAVIAFAGFVTFAPAYVAKQRNGVIAHDPYPVSDAAAELHASLLVGDWHADPLLWKRDLTERGTYGQVDLPRLREGNVGMQVFTAVTKSPSGQNYEQNSAEAFDNITLLAVGQLWPMRTWDSLLQRAIYQADKLAGFEAKAPDHLKIVRSLADLEEVIAARQNGSQVTAGILGIEGAHALEGDIANMDALEDAGYRLIGLHHFFDNELGGSLHGISNAGLNDFGTAVVSEAAKRGMVIDVAHSSPAVARDVLALVEQPIVVSHSGLHGYCPVKRNYQDSLMKAIADKGGVIGMGYWTGAACDDITPAGIAKMIRAAVETLGEDHVSLGSDFDGSVETAFDTSELAALTHALMLEGLSEPQIRKVMGDNMLRVLRASLK